MITSVEQLSQCLPLLPALRCMNGSIIDVHRRFVHRFGQCWMRVTGAGDVFATGPELHGGCGFGDQVTGA